MSDEPEQPSHRLSSSDEPGRPSQVVNLDESSSDLDQFSLHDEQDTVVMPHESGATPPPHPTDLERPRVSPRSLQQSLSREGSWETTSEPNEFSLEVTEDAVVVPHGS